MDFQHTSVLLNEAVDGLLVGENGIYLDGTLGGGGHSEQIAKRLTNGRLICIDRDLEAIAACKERLREFSNITFIHDNFTNSTEVLKNEGIHEVNGILLDLGVSSHQIDTKERGFSYSNEDAPLDMRMDATGTLTAKDILNTYSREELIHIFKAYGEEKFASRIASNIEKVREHKPFQTTGDLNLVIQKSVPKKHTGGHPSKRVFQALRIEVNDELSPLKKAIESMIDLLSDGGRCCVITFHSLEDRIVKTVFKEAQNPCTCPPEFPVCVCGKKPKGRIITSKPIVPSESECTENPRAKSAKLRIFERIKQ